MSAVPPSTWWSRKAPPLRTDNAALYGGPHPGRSALMTPATSPKPMSGTKPRFNLAAVLPSFGQRSKKQSPLDIQDPPSHVRSLPSIRSSPNARLSRGAASGTSLDSTDGPLTPSDEPERVSYQHSIMTLTDDPFASDSPLDARRASGHSDKSIGKRLMSRVDGRSKTTSRLPVGATSPKRKNSRDRSATLPSRVRTASDTYLPLRAVEPPWQPSSPPASPPTRKPKTSKPSMPWPEVHSSSHQRTPSSSSATKLRPERPDGGRGSVSSSIYSAGPLPISPTSPSSHRSRPSTASNQTTPTISSQLSLPPGPPPMQELPPTPGSGSATHLRVRADTVASASASSISFTSSLSSLSFNSRPSPRDSAPPQAYPSLLGEELPSESPTRRGSDSGSSLASGSGSRAYRLPSPPPVPKQPARPLPTPPAAPRERALSSTSSTGDGSSIRTLRKQRSFHNTSLNSPTPRTPILRHYNSFEPPLPRSPPPQPQDLPPVPSSHTSPRRKLFSSRGRGEAPVSPPVPATPLPMPAQSSLWYDESTATPAAPAPSTSPPLSDVAQHIVPPAELLRLGAAWELESESQHKARLSAGPSRLLPPPRSAGALPGAAPAWGSSPPSRLPRSASLLGRAPRTEPESYTSLSPPPRRRAVTAARVRTTSESTRSSGGGARMERKPSFLDMSTRRVSIELPDPEPGRDSFLELSRGMDSIDTIRESEASFS